MSLLFTSMEAFLKEPTTLHPDFVESLHTTINTLPEDRLIEIQELIDNTGVSFLEIINEGYKLALDAFFRDMNDVTEGA